MRKTHFSQEAPKDNLKSKTNLYYQNKRNKDKHALNIHVYVLSCDICLKNKKAKIGRIYKCYLMQKYAIFTKIR